jgi:hypothetical protein
MLGTQELLKKTYKKKYIEKAYKIENKFYVPKKVGLNWIEFIH